MNPTQRTIAECRKRGYIAEIVEKWNSFSKTRRDFIGIVDIITFSPEIGVIGIQTTSGSNHPARVSKALMEPRLKIWLKSGGRFAVWSWSKKGPRGERKLWQLREQEIKEADLSNFTKIPIP